MDWMFEIFFSQNRTKASWYSTLAPVKEIRIYTLKGKVHISLRCLGTCLVFWLVVFLVIHSYGSKVKKDKNNKVKCSAISPNFSPLNVGVGNMEERLFVHKVLD